MAFKGIKLKKEIQILEDNLLAKTQKRSKGNLSGSKGNRKKKMSSSNADSQRAGD